MHVCGRQLVVDGHGRVVAGAEHDRGVGAVDVGVEQADLMAGARHGDRQVRGDRALANAALTGGDGDDLLSRRQQRRGLLAGKRWTSGHAGSF